MMSLKQSFGVFAGLLVASPLLAAPPRVNVTVQVDGQTYGGTLAPTAQGAQLPAAEEISGGPAPLGVHLDAADALDPAALRDVRVSWDFGDLHAPRNTMAGFNAAHVYDAAGTYTITRTIDAPTRQTVRTYRVVVGENTRRTIHLSADGDDRQSGATPASAVRSWARAIALVGRTGNVQLLVRRGDTIDVDRTWTAAGDHVRLGAYGDVGNRPVLRVDVEKAPSIAIFRATGRAAIVEDVAFDANDSGTDQRNMPHAISAAGRGLVVRRCEILNAGYMVNGNGAPDGVLVSENISPSPTGLRAYLCWVEGRSWTITGNRAVNSTREHIIRVGGAEWLNIQGNTFTNQDRRPADPHDFAKSAINIQVGRAAYVAGNTLSGELSIGPLGGGDGKHLKAQRWIGATFENNVVANAMIHVQHGASGITIRNNLVRRNDDPAFRIMGRNDEYERSVEHVLLERNTAINEGTRGTMVQIDRGATGVELVGNLYVAPRLITGPYSAAAVNVADLASLTRVAGNVWPTPAAAGRDTKGSVWVIAGAYAPPPASIVAADRVEKIAAEALTVDGAGVEASQLPSP